MNVHELIAGLKHAEEQLHRAISAQDHVTDKTLIDAIIYEQNAWETRCRYYRMKLREVVKRGQKVEGRWHICRES